MEPFSHIYTTTGEIELQKSSFSSINLRSKKASRDFLDSILMYGNECVIPENTKMFSGYNVVTADNDNTLVVSLSPRFRTIWFENKTRSKVAHSDLDGKDFFYIPVPRTVYVISRNRNGDPVKVYVGVAPGKKPIGKDTTLYILPIPNIGSGGYICFPEDFYAIGGSIHDVVNGVDAALWNSNFNMDWTDAFVSILSKAKSFPPLNGKSVGECTLKSILKAWASCSLDDLMKPSAWTGVASSSLNTVMASSAKLGRRNAVDLPEIIRRSALLAELKMKSTEKVRA